MRRLLTAFAVVFVAAVFAPSAFAQGEGGEGGAGGAGGGVELLRGFLERTAGGADNAGAGGLGCGGEQEGTRGRRG